MPILKHKLNFEAAVCRFVVCSSFVDLKLIKYKRYYCGKHFKNLWLKYGLKNSLSLFIYIYIYIH